MALVVDVSEYVSFLLFVYYLSANLIDSAQFRSISRAYYRGAHAIVFMVDCTSKDSVLDARMEFTKLMSLEELRHDIPYLSM